MKGDFFIIAGPCVIENRGHALFMARELKRVIELEHGIPFIFKASYDKANRTSLKSYRGPGLERGLEILRDIGDELKVPLLSDVHDIFEVAKAAEVLDIIQIPAFLCRQTDLLVAAAATGRTVNIKKGQFMSPWAMEHVVAKCGEADVMLTERGSSFGYGDLVVDFRSIPIMKKFGRVVLDVTHSVQKPGAAGDHSGGAPEFISTLTEAGVAVGVDGLFMEVHDDPSKALSDGANALPLNQLPELMDRILSLREC